jgi:hypothetical protein
MKEVKLTDDDYSFIASRAADKFSKDSAYRFSGTSFLCKCYISAVLEFTNSKKIVIIDGKIIEKEELTFNRREE